VQKSGASGQDDWADYQARATGVADTEALHTCDVCMGRHYCSVLRAAPEPHLPRRAQQRHARC
jgi:hypothetical protein